MNACAYIQLSKRVPLVYLSQIKKKNAFTALTHVINTISIFNEFIQTLYTMNDHCIHINR